jgi:outer membrane lipoprotein-sorting protein
MRTNQHLAIRLTLLTILFVTLTTISARIRADSGTCSGATVTLPFNDVMSSPFFCTIAAAYFSGLTNGTTATTYSPGNVVTREQMAAFTTRTLDQSLRRGSRRAALGQWWTPKTGAWFRGRTSFINPPGDVVSDGEFIWVAAVDTLVRVRTFIPMVPEDTNGITSFQTPAQALVVASGAVFVGGGSTLSYAAPFGVYPVSTNFTPDLLCLAFDGEYVWTGSSSGLIGKVNLQTFAVTTANTGLGILTGMVYDGHNVWVCERNNFIGQINKLDANGAVITTVGTGARPGRPVFDGTNIWVPNRQSNSVTVIRVKDANGNPLATPFVLAQLSGNGLNAPVAAAFDGERILITNASAPTVSLWKATDLAPLGSYSVPYSSGVTAACSDGLGFWLTTLNDNNLIRF